MSANELRQAAETERAEWGGTQNARNYPRSSAIHLALADWLDQVADRIEQLTTQNVPPSMRDHAERVARLINGGAA